MAVFIGAIGGYRQYYSNDPKIMTSRFAGECAESGRKIKKGDTIIYFPFSRKAYLVGYAPMAERSYREFRAAADDEDFGYNRSL
jgi:predicted Mrr-cat superfamily restriction endonuclease